MLDFLFEFLSDVFGLNSGILNTKKIDKNIDLLNKHDWFKKVYEDEKYRRLFIANRQVRAYLQSNIRVKKIIRSNEAQKKLLILLDKQLKT